MTELQSLEAWFLGQSRVLLGYSGGVDSALLAVVAARALGSHRFVAVIGKSASYPAVQWTTALAIAARFAVPTREVETRELADPRYLANPLDRCYFCKTELWSVLERVATELGFSVIVDGTNADDLAEHRPGAVAGAERRVRSPLAELGWTKSMVRAAAANLGIPNAAAPASPCLSSRVRYGVGITPERLRQVEAGEAFLRGLGLAGNLRVRHLGDEARIEVDPEELPVVTERWPVIEARFAELGFAAVTWDPRGYRRGSLLPVMAGDGTG